MTAMNVRHCQHKRSAPQFFNRSPDCRLWSTVLPALICLPLLLGFATEAWAQGQTVLLSDIDDDPLDIIYIDQDGAGSVNEGNRKDFSVRRILDPAAGNSGDWGFKLCVSGTATGNPNPTFTSRHTPSGTYDFELWQWSGPLKLSSSCASKTFRYSSDRERVDFQIYPIKDTVTESDETITPTISEPHNTDLVSDWKSISITITD